MNITELIEVLQNFKKQHGDVPVIMSSDTEGNEFSTLDKRFSPCQVLNDTSDKTIGLCLYPHYEHLEDMVEAINMSKRSK